MSSPTFRAPTILSPALCIALAATCVFVVIMSVLQLITGTSDAEMEALAASNSPVDLALGLGVGLSAMAFLLSFFAGIVLFPMYLYRAVSNLNALGVTLATTTPGMAAGSWFIPFANLVLPYRALTEIEQGSQPDGVAPPSSKVGVYWGFWIASNILLRIGEHVPIVSVVGALALCTAGFLAIAIIRGIDQSQQRLAQRSYASDFAPVFA